MNPLRLIDSNGKPLPLDRHLASGGEGAVYLIAGAPNHVAKVYHKPPSPQSIEKLTTMVALANPRLLELAAWPSQLLRSEATRQVAGFVMPRLIDCEPIQHLYNPVMRLKVFSRAAWNFQVRTAYNLAAAFDEVHKAGCLVGDVNQSNAQVSQQALVRLVDCDSFQVTARGKQFLCEVGTPHYTPPELQGKNLRGHPRTENHDRFGMAVLIYQLLFVGRHPYAGMFTGKGDPSFEQLIAEYRFAQGPMAKSWQMAPPPHTPIFSDIPAELSSLFRCAFERGSENGNRPRPAEWLPALSTLERNTIECKEDSGHKYWQGAGKCVWCRIAEKGPEYYYGIATSSSTFVVDEAKLQQVMRRLSAAQLTELTYNREQFYRPNSLYQPKPIPVEIAQLYNKFERLKQELNKIRNIEAVEDAAEDAKNAAIEQRHRIELERQRLEIVKRLDAEYDDAILSEQAERNYRRHVDYILMIAVLIGLAIVPIGLYRPVIAVFGMAIMIVFGVWLGIHTVMSGNTGLRRRLRGIVEEKEALKWYVNEGIVKLRNKAGAERQQLNQRRRESRTDFYKAYSRSESAFNSLLENELKARTATLNSAEAILSKPERNWTKNVEDYRQQYSTVSNAVASLIYECRNLTAQYSDELKLITASAAELAKTRHMRLHLIADADIPRIGVARKQALAMHGIQTADDIDERRIISIDGFGESYTNSLLSWKRLVLSSFRFDITKAISPASLQGVNVRFRSRQQDYLNRIEEQMRRLDTLAKSCRSSVDNLKTEIVEAVKRVQQAEADIRVLPAKQESA